MINDVRAGGQRRRRRSSGSSCIFRTPLERQRALSFPNTLRASKLIKAQIRNKISISRELGT